jgi:hypothetical protein
LVTLSAKWLQETISFGHFFKLVFVDDLRLKGRLEKHIKLMIYVPEPSVFQPSGARDVDVEGCGCSCEE